jgi:hypothetical protein
VLTCSRVTYTPICPSYCKCSFSIPRLLQTSKHIAAALSGASNSPELQAAYRLKPADTWHVAVTNYTKLLAGQEGGGQQVLQQVAAALATAGAAVEGLRLPQGPAEATAAGQSPLQAAPSSSSSSSSSVTGRLVGGLFDLMPDIFDNPKEALQVRVHLFSGVWASGSTGDCEEAALCSHPSYENRHALSEGSHIRCHGRYMSCICAAAFRVCFGNVQASQMAVPSYVVTCKVQQGCCAQLSSTDVLSVYAYVVTKCHWLHLPVGPCYAAAAPRNVFGRPAAATVSQCCPHSSSCGKSSPSKWPECAECCGWLCEAECSWLCCGSLEEMAGSSC